MTDTFQPKAPSRAASGGPRPGATVRPPLADEQREHDAFTLEQKMAAQPGAPEERNQVLVGLAIAGVAIVVAVALMLI